tara:strand:- start:139 stop:318 length:180 start_codon:yes stop_codon:yes gene_type:complete
MNFKEFIRMYYPEIPVSDLYLSLIERVGKGEKIISIFPRVEDKSRIIKAWVEYDSISSN